MDGLRNSLDGLREACGVFAVHDHPEAVRLTYYGLYALQHRGQESAGIAACRPGEEICHYRAMGLVSEAFDAETLERLAGGPRGLGPRTESGRASRRGAEAGRGRGAERAHLR